VNSAAQLQSKGENRIAQLKMRGANNTYHSSIEACFYNRRFSLEIMDGDLIYDNQIETFSGV
jgi:hypothetical protein